MTDLPTYQHIEPNTIEKEIMADRHFELTELNYNEIHYQFRQPDRYKLFEIAE